MRTLNAKFLINFVAPGTILVLVSIYLLWMSIPARQADTGVNLILTRVIAIFVITLLLLAILTVLNIRYFIIKPIKRLEQEVKLIESTYDLSHRITIQSNDEVGELARSFNEMLGTIHSSDEKLKDAYAIQNLVMVISTNLINLPSDMFDDGIREALMQVGDFAGVDRVNLVQYNDGLTKLNISHEWSASGIEVSRQHAKDIPLDAIDWLQSNLKLRTPVAIPRMSDLNGNTGHLKSLWVDEGICSLLILPFAVDEAGITSIELEMVDTEMTWTEETITLLQFLSPVLQNVLKRKEVDETLTQQNAELLQYREHLEDLIAGRTAELQQTNEKLEAEIQSREDVAQSLKNQEKQYRDLFEQAGESIFIVDTTSKKVVAANKNASRRLGYTGEELQTLGVNDIEIKLPDEAGQIRHSLTGESFIYECLHIHKTGKTIPVEVNSKVIKYKNKTALQWFVRDITDRKETEKFLKQANDELTILNDLSRELLYTLELKTLLSPVAQKIVAILGADRCSVFLHNKRSNRLEVIATHGYMSSRLTDFSYSVGEESVGQSFLTAKSIYIPDIFQEANLQKRDDIRTLLAIPLKSSSGITGVLSVVSLEPDYFSASQQRLLETMAGLITSAIERAQLFEAAQQADRLKSAFLATMSHELRTPLNSIIGFTGILLQGLVGPLTDEQDKQLNMVRDSARHLLALISDVLDISKIEAGQLKVKNDSFDMKDAIQKVVKVIKPMIEKKQLELIVEISSEVGQIYSDRRRVEQILINLLNNAVKFTEEGSVRIESSIDGNYLLTRVIDTGIGIQADDMDTLFKPFRQIDTGLSRQKEGTGLGLSICKKLTELLQGEISVTSEPGAGSTFTIKLPISQGEE